MLDLRTADLRKLNSLTKYPSIPTHHALDPKNGGLLEEPTAFTGPVIGTEKVDGCLTRDTRVTLADGSRKAINRLVAGDLVLGVDPEGKVVPTPVLRTFNNGPAEAWMKIKGHRANAGRGSSFFSVNCTPNHRFWLPKESTYRPAEELHVGDSVTVLRSELDLTPVQKSVLLGKLLGDGHMQRAASGSVSVVWGHRAADREYVHWTQRALGDIASTALRTRSSGYGTEMLDARTIFHPALAERFGNMIASNKKMVPEWVADALDPLALAFWYMDDGSLSTAEGQEDRAMFATNAFSEEDCKILLRGLARLGIDGVLQETRGSLTIRLNATAAEQLFLLVAPYVPPVMQRKLPERYRGHDGWLPPVGAGFRDMLTEQVIDEIEWNPKNVSSLRYDIETGTHNFFANGVLVHNSNGRIILLPGGEWLIGSREDLLTASGDIIHNPALGIVDTLREFADQHAPGGDEITVLYVEVYGSKQLPAWKHYGQGDAAFRLFDIAVVEIDMLDWDIQRIASWRQRGGQRFLPEVELRKSAESYGADLPHNVEVMRTFLEPYKTTTVATSGEPGLNEGVVLRSADRSTITKARFQDYDRTLKRREKTARQHRPA